MPYKTDLTDEQFALINPLLDDFNSQFSGLGRPREEDRPLLDGILWRLDNGAKWRAIPAEYGN
ncbi:transposase, partial [Candidatus Poribacteria bacterium]|nr:transposase [Candidatus Poribacteria bacterium]